MKNAASSSKSRQIQSNQATSNNKKSIVVLFISTLIFASTTVYLITKGSQNITPFNPNQPEWKTEGGLHFTYSQPNGWHMYWDIDNFYLSSKPIIRAPHQHIAEIQGTTMSDSKAEEREMELQSSHELRRINMRGSDSSCFISKKKDVAMASPTIDGYMLCIISFPWEKSHSVNYEFRANNTNQPEIKDLFETFIESLKPIH